MRLLFSMRWLFVPVALSSRSYLPDLSEHWQRDRSRRRSAAWRGFFVVGRVREPAVKELLLPHWTFSGPFFDFLRKIASAFLAGNAFS